MSDSAEDTTMLNRVYNDMRDMKLAMSQMAEAITRLAVLEEKHLGVVGTLQRVVEHVDKLDDKVQDLNLQVATAQGQARGAGWVIKTVWGIIGTILIAGLGLIGNSVFGIFGTPPL